MNTPRRAPRAAATRSAPRAGQRPASTEARGARLARGPNGIISNWLLRHLQTFFYSLGQLSRRPVATLMTAAVIGIALALPTGLHVMLKNAQHVTAGWDGATQISLFLRASVNERRALSLLSDLERRDDINKVQYISRDDALEEFRRLSGFGQALDALNENPLPAVLVVQPILKAGGADAVGDLLERLGALPEVELAQLDMQWVKRLYALMDIIGRGIWVLASLLALAVLLVVGNTIRLAINNQREEIVVIKLVGGTNAFIRRPFLYTGFWYGLSGGVIAVLLVTVSQLLLQEPVHHLAALYHSPFRIHNLAESEVLTVLAIAAGLGLVGSWLAVGRHLRDIEPR